MRDQQQMVATSSEC